MEHVRHLCVLRMTHGGRRRDIRGETYKLGNGPRCTGMLHEAIMRLVPPSLARKRKAGTV